MSLIVKICGLKSAEAVDAALDSGADMIGFVFFPPSPRNVAFDTARTLSERVRGGALKVPLSVDATDALLRQIIESLAPDLLQLHGRESPDRVSAVRRRFGLPVMKALPIAEEADLAAIGTYEQQADRLIFDARAPREASRPGGLGRRFDWHLLRNIATAAPFMLSGGLDVDNVAEALRITQAPGVDVSSGIERALGEKDPDRIRAFVAAARRATEKQIAASE